MPSNPIAQRCDKSLNDCHALPILRLDVANNFLKQIKQED
jgi:hypothetical protein